MSEPAPPMIPVDPDLPMARVDVQSARWVWLVPLAAVAIVAAMLLRDWVARGPTVAVALPRASGMAPGVTPVLSQGVPIGVVETIRLDATLSHPIAEVRLERWAADFAREGAVWWIVRPSIGFRGVSGLETLTSGPVLEARPGRADAARAVDFTALSRAPADAIAGSGLRLSLIAPRLGSIRPGSPVTYRDVEVGEVVGAALAADATAVAIEVTIADRYAPLVRQGSRFWSRSGFGVDVGVTGLKFRTESLESMLGGGIAFATPSAVAAPVESGSSFPLAEEAEKDWLRWAPPIELAK